MLGKIHSFETFGTVDGPGIRFVVFMQGCPLRCLYCHNPDTQTLEGGKEYSAEEVANLALKYYNYYKNGGGITVSGGEPLLQIEFLTQLFIRLKQKGFHTAIDTSGITFNANDLNSVKKHEELLKYTDLVLLDLKHINAQKHCALTGVSNKNPLDFAKYLSDCGKEIWLRHVLVPGYTDDDEDLKELSHFIKTLKTVKKTEVLPYHTMGEVKYEKLGLNYALKGVLPPTQERIANAKKILKT